MVVDDVKAGRRCIDLREGARDVIGLEDRVLDPARCRQRVAERWSPDRIAAGYETVYRNVRRPAPPGIIAPAA